MVLRSLSLVWLAYRLLHACLIWSLVFRDVDSEINSLVMEVSLSLDSLCCILNAQHWSLIVVTILALLNSSCLTLAVEISFRLSTDIACVLIRIDLCLTLWDAGSVSLDLAVLALLCSAFSLLSESFLVIVVVQVLSQVWSITLKLSDVTLWNLHLLWAWSSLGQLAFLALFSTALLIWASDDLDLLVDLDWSVGNSNATVWSHSTDCGIGQSIMNLKLHTSLVCGWRWELCLDVHWIDSLFDSIDLLKIDSLWRFLGRGLALVSTTNSLWVTLDDHWLEWWNLLLIIIFIDVCWWRSHAVNSFTDVLGLSVALWVLGRVSFGINLHSISLLLGKIVLDQWLMMLDLLLVRQVVGCLVLLDHLLEWVSVEALLLVVTEDHALSFKLILWNDLVVLSGVWILLESELFNAVAVHLEFRKLIMSVVLCSWDVWVEIKNTFIWSF